ncbi:MAG: phosphatase PAP2 family protein, partial [Bacteroidia bacterium]|nr:phosphatase PAP2 family protein [Bacteroidia bacterium]
QSKTIRGNTVSAFLLLLTAQLMNFYIKSSMHTAFNLFLVFLILPMSSVFAILYLGFTFLIAWSRLVLKRHTLKEVVSGAIIGLVFGLISFFTLQN